MHTATVDENDPKCYTSVYYVQVVQSTLNRVTPRAPISPRLTRKTAFGWREIEPEVILGNVQVLGRIRVYADVIHDVGRLGGCRDVFNSRRCHAIRRRISAQCQSRVNLSRLHASTKGMFKLIPLIYVELCTLQQLLERVHWCLTTLCIDASTEKPAKRPTSKPEM